MMTIPFQFTDTSSNVVNNYVELYQNTSISQQFGFNSNRLLSPEYDLVPKPSLPHITKPEINSVPFFFTYVTISLLVAILYTVSFSTFRDIFNSFTSNPSLLQYLEERTSTNGLVSLGVFLVGLFTTSVFIYQALAYYVKPILPLFTLQPMEFIGLVFTALFAGFVGKALIVLLSAILFSRLGLIKEYLSLQILSVQVLGIFLFPLSVVVRFAHQLNSGFFLQFGLLLIALFFTYRIVRTYFLGVRHTNSQVFHIILYICALEILPLLLLGKVLLNT